MTYLWGPFFGGHSRLSFVNKLQVQYNPKKTVLNLPEILTAKLQDAQRELEPALP